MDTVNHAVSGFLMGYIPFSQDQTIAIIIGMVCAIIAASPDLIGEYYANIKKDKYQWYNSAHSGKINAIMKWFPPWGLHTFLDKHGHGAGERWYAGIWYEYFMPWRWKERMWLEVLVAFINLILIILVFFVF